MPGQMIKTSEESQSGFVDPYQEAPNVE